MKIEGKKVIFSTGREISAYGGVIGIAPDMEATSGYDGTIYRKQFYVEDDEEYAATDPLTADERIEMANYMIAKWEAFKAEAEKER